MNSDQTPIESERLVGIAKKINKELDGLPYASHAAIIGVLGVLVQHRQAVEMGRAREAQHKEQLAREFAVPSAIRQ